MKTVKRLILVLFLLFVLVLLLPFIMGIRFHFHFPWPVSSAYDGDSTGLKATEIVPTLDTPIATGKNAIWCASFPAAWKALEQVAGEPPTLVGNPAVVARLNAAADPRASVPPANLYANAGWSQQGIIQQIQADMGRQFPDRPAPELSEVPPDSLVAYAYLAAAVKFPQPYHDNSKPLMFTDAAGKQTGIRSFGILDGDENASSDLRAQTHFLFRGDMLMERPSAEFAIDLGGSADGEVIVAKIPRQPTLAEDLTYVETNAASWETNFDGNSESSLYSGDVLLVPDMRWSVSHHFSELEKQKLTNQKLKDDRLEEAREDISFRLDKNGAALSAESTLVVTRAMHMHYALDQPFLIYLKQPGAAEPYFAMWVDNPELLSRY